MNVAVAVITDAKRHFLITQRALHVLHPGLWEFPGGKVEAHESAREALVREIKEEVGLDIQQCCFLGEIKHAYDEYSVSLLVYHVSEFSGSAYTREQQADLRWVAFDELSNYHFPKANHQILKLIEGQLISSP